MLWRFIGLSILGTLVNVVGHAGGQDEKKLAELDGTWTVIKIESEGMSLLKKDEKVNLIIKDGKVTSDWKAAPKEAITISNYLEPSKTPKRITYPYDPKITFVGIYEVKGDELHICGNGVDATTEKNLEGRRPKKFDSKEGLLLVFKREKK